MHNPFCPFAVTRPEMERDIRRRFGQHPMGYEIPVKKPARELAGLRDRLIAGARTKGEVSRWVLGARPWDFFMTVFGEAHYGGHALWPVEGPIGADVPPDSLRDVYRAVDDALGIVLDALDLSETTVIIFAPHGMGANHSKEYLTQAVVDQINRRFMQEHRNGGPAKELRGQHSLMRSLRYRVPVRVQNAIALAGPHALRDFVMDRSLTGGYDWTETPAIAVRGDVNGYVRLNLRDRERDGMLGSEDAQNYLEMGRECFFKFTQCRDRESRREGCSYRAAKVPG